MNQLAKADLKAVVDTAVDYVVRWDGNNSLRVLNPWTQGDPLARVYWTIGYGGAPFPEVEYKNDEYRMYLYKAWCVGVKTRELLTLR